MSSTRRKLPSGAKKPKRHVGDLSKATWDKEGLLQEVKSYPDGFQVNWSKLARRYQITNKAGRVSSNGGQIAQEFVIRKRENVHRFAKKHKLGGIDSGPIIRRKKLRVAGGEITLPTMETVDQIKEKLAQKIQNGTYTAGEKIVPREYEKLILKDGKLEIKTFVVEGRKIPLQEIRQRTLNEHNEFLRVHSDNYYDNLSNSMIQNRNNLMSMMQI